MQIVQKKLRKYSQTNNTDAHHRLDPVHLRDAMTRTVRKKPKLHKRTIILDEPEMNKTFCK